MAHLRINNVIGRLWVNDVVTPVIILVFRFEGGLFISHLKT